MTLVDPRELELPDVGLMEVEDPETGETMLVDTGNPRVREAYRDRARGLAGQRSALFRGLGVDELVLRTDQTYVKPLAEFFERRARRQVRRKRVAL